MGKNILRINYDEFGDALNVWFEDKNKETHCTEVDEGIILCKDTSDNVIGVEILSFSKLVKNKIIEIPIAA